MNRTFDKAQALARELAGYFSGPRVLGPAARLEAVPWEERSLRSQLARTDLVVNATTLGLRQSDRSPLPHALIAPHLMVYDLLYKKTPTRLLAAAAEAGARGANGLTMLLHQGAIAFELWFDRPAPLAAMRGRSDSSGPQSPLNLPHAARRKYFTRRPLHRAALGAKESQHVFREEDSERAAEKVEGLGEKSSPQRAFRAAVPTDIHPRRRGDLSPTGRKHYRHRPQRRS